MRVAVASWLDERTGWKRLRALALDEEVPGGASWAYVLGSVTTFLLLMQALTGVLLAIHYAPTTTDAWASVAHIQDAVPFGWLVRGLHAHGASALVLVMGLHLLQVATWGAYKKPRELTWIVGVLLLGVILAFSLTGYLLPWDQKGYWATQVATGIMASSPVIGEELARVVQGGDTYGNATLGRFFVLHVLVLPAAVVALVVAHVSLFRRRGVTPRWDRGPAELTARSEPFGARQLRLDILAMLLVYGLVVAYTWSTGGASLEAPADPSSDYQARPEWYFLPLFQLLKYCSGPLETLVALGAPVVVFGTLLALPFVDRGASRAPAARKPFVGVVLLGALSAVALIGLARRDDAANPAYQKAQVEAAAQARKARSLALAGGVPAAGGLAVWENEPHHRARQVWAERCASCHEGAERKGPAIGPGYNSRPWIRAFLLDPSGDRFFGRTAIQQMKPVTASGAELDALVEVVYAQTGATDVNQPLAERGRALFESGTCVDCHSLEKHGSGDVGPALHGRGSPRWFQHLVADASSPAYFGDANQMPPFEEELSAADLEALGLWLASLRDVD